MLMISVKEQVKKNKKQKKHLRHHHSEIESILIEIWIVVFKMSAHFGHIARSDET